MNIWNRFSKITQFAWFVLLLAAGGGCAVSEPISTPTPTETPPPAFDGARAYLDAAHQAEIGPRFPGSPGHLEVRQWIEQSLLDAGWMVEIQESTFAGQPVFNIEAVQYERREGLPWVLIGAHYDTRMVADRDPEPENRREPVPGANDGASGVAVLLELARILPKNLDVNLSLVFFDAEDNGSIPGWDWILGSRSYVEGLTTYPDKVIIVDMIGDRDQNIYIEKSSDQVLAAEIWQIASQLNINTFIHEQKYHIIDDHTPFLEKGVQAIDIIDFEYSYWHTTQDTLDKIDASSLQNVGDVLLFWLLQNYGT